MTCSSRIIQSASVLALSVVALLTTPPRLPAAESPATCDLCTNSCVSDPAKRCRERGCGNNYESCSPITCKGTDGNNYDYRIDCIR